MSILKEIEYAIDQHMDCNPHEVRCSECGRDLHFTSDVDSDYDVSIVVEPCDCAEE